MRLRVGAIVVLFVVVASAFISNPGLYYDETLFVNVAVGAPINMFVERVWDVPLLLMPYIGALKAWIYVPIFRAFGVSAATVRLPMVLLSAATLLLGYDIARRFLRPSLALAFLVLMATDPAFVIQSRLDWGPVVIGLFLKLLALWFLALVLTRGSSLAFFGFLAACALGVFDKLTFIWFVNGTILAAGLVYWRPLLAYTRRAPIRAAIAVTVFAGVWYASFERISFLVRRPVTFENPNTVDRLQRIAALINSTANGDAVWFITRSEPIPQTTLVAPCFWLALGAIAVWWVLRRGAATRAASAPLSAALAFSVVMIIAILVQFALTPNIIGPHHTLMLWPFHHFLIVAAAALMLDEAWPHVNIRRVVTAAATAVLTILLGSQVWVTSLYVRSYASANGYRPSWDPAIYQLSDAIERRLDPQSIVIAADWGLTTQLLALSPPEHRKTLRDWWPAFNDLARAPEGERTSMRQRLLRPGALVVTHSAEASVMPHTRSNLHQFVQDEHLRLERLDTIASADGRPLYEISRVVSDRMTP